LDTLLVLNEHGSLSVTNLRDYSRLSWGDRTIIGELVKRGLIEFFKKSKGRNKLQLTDAGRIVLSHYQAIRKAIE